MRPNPPPTRAAGNSVRTFAIPRFMNAVILGILFGLEATAVTLMRWRSIGCGLSAGRSCLAALASRDIDHDFSHLAESLGRFGGFGHNRRTSPARSPKACPCAFVKRRLANLTCQV